MKHFYFTVERTENGFILNINHVQDVCTTINEVLQRLDTALEQLEKSEAE